MPRQAFSGSGRAVWPVAGQLFPLLDAAAQTALARLPEALARVWPLSAAHRRSLPGDVAALSRLLTETRAELRQPYWSRPNFVSAYLYYFLPWNLVRLMRLCLGLPLPEPCPAGGGLPPLLADAGSGPLTLPLALWLARPQWRALPIRVLALDSVARPLELGRALFSALGEVLGEPVWQIHLARGPLEHLASAAAPLFGRARGRPGRTDHAGQSGQSGQSGHHGDAARVWLVTAANTLNELRPPKACRAHGAAFAPAGAVASGNDDGPGEIPGDCPDEYTDERLERLLHAWRPLLLTPFAGDSPKRDRRTQRREESAPALLLVEPGTRLGGTTLMRMRDLALENGLRPLAPCVRPAGECPLRGRGVDAGSGHGTARSWRGSWCHFTVSVEGAPPWLASLSARAGLAKRSLVLSTLLLAPAGQNEADAQKTARLRVLSSPFAVPGVAGLARYACAPWGLALLERAGALPCGALLNVPPESGSGYGPEHGAGNDTPGGLPPATDTAAPAARLDGRSGARLVTAPAPQSQPGRDRKRHSEPPHEDRPQPPAGARRGGIRRAGGKKSQKK